MHVTRRLKMAVPIAFVPILLSLTPTGVVAGQYFEENTSGSGTTTGTAMYYTTWSGAPALLPPESPSNPCTRPSPYCSSYHESGVTEGFTNESVWIENGRSPSIEAGFRLGFASGANGGWSTDMLPYYTLNDGVPQVNATANYALPANTTIWIAAIVCQSGHNANVQVNNWVPNVGCYSIPTPRTNYAQGETLYGDDQMGGSHDNLPGPVQSMLYQPASQYPNGWAYWSSMKCELYDGSLTQFPPYNEGFFYASNCNVGGSPHQWVNWGAGNGDLGS